MLIFKNEHNLLCEVLNLVDEADENQSRGQNKHQLLSFVNKIWIKQKS